MFIALSRTCIQNFNNQHSAFVFLSHSIAVAAWSGIQHVEPLLIYFEAFYNLVRGGYFSTSTPPNNIFLVKAAERIYFKHSSKKDNYPSPYPEQRFCLSLQIWDELIVFSRLSRGFLVISGASNLRFSWNCSRLGLLTIVRAISLSSLFYI